MDSGTAFIEHDGFGSSDAMALGALPVARRVNVHGAVGGPTPKPTKPRSNNAWVEKLSKKVGENNHARFTDMSWKVSPAVQFAPHSDGRKRCSGNAGALKNSQTYPQQYAEELLTSFKSEGTEWLSDSESSESDCPVVPGDNDEAWQDLDIGRMPEMMSQQSGRMPRNII